MRHLASASAILAFSAFEARADEAELRVTIAQQERRIAELERKLDELIARESRAGVKPASERAQPAQAFATQRSATESFTVASGDGVNTLRLRGLVHFDGRYFADDFAPATADAWVLRRVRPTLEASLGGLGEVRLTPEFGGGRSSILDASIAMRLRPSLTITAGKFKVPVGLERLMPANSLRFIERGFPTSLVPNRDTGVQIGGSVGRSVGYTVGYFTGVVDGASSDNNVPTPDAENDTNGDWAARVFVTPFSKLDLGVGIGATYTDVGGSSDAALLPTFRTSGQQVFFRYRAGSFASGTRLRLAPQLYYHHGSLGILGEYTQVEQDVSRASFAGLRTATLDTRAWQVQLAWLLTGEREAFNGGIAPNRPFSFDGDGWGSLELVARYHGIDIDDAAFAGEDPFADVSASASRASAWGVGFNWRFNAHYAWSLNYDRTRFEGGFGALDRPDEEAVVTRFSAAF